jgi:hypothetical protein
MGMWFFLKIRIIGQILSFRLINVPEKSWNLLMYGTECASAVDVATSQPRGRTATDLGTLYPLVTITS